MAGGPPAAGMPVEMLMVDFYGQAKLNAKQWGQLGKHNEAITNLFENPHPQKAVLQVSMFGVRGGLPSAMGATLTSTPLFQFNLLQVLLSKAIDRQIVIAVKNTLTPGQTDADRMFSIFCFNTASPAEAARFAHAVVEYRAGWEDLAKQIIMNNFSIEQLTNSTVKELAEAFDRTPAQILVRWVVTQWEQKKGALKLPTSISPPQLAEMFGVAGWVMSTTHFLALKAIVGLGPVISSAKGGVSPRPSVSPQQQPQESRGGAPFSPKLKTGDSMQYKVDAARLAHLTATELKAIVDKMHATYHGKTKIAIQDLVNVVSQFRRIEDPRLFAEMLFRGFDKDGDGFIDYEEYACFLAVTSSTNIDEQLSTMFRVFDSDGNGDLDVDELAHMIKLMAKLDEKKMPDMDELEPDIIAEMMHLDFDENGDGKVQLSEFVAMCKANGMLNTVLQSTTVADDSRGPRSAWNKGSSNSLGSNISVNSSASQVGARR